MVVNLYLINIFCINVFEECSVPHKLSLGEFLISHDKCGELVSWPFFGSGFDKSSVYFTLRLFFDSIFGHGAEGRQSHPTLLFTMGLCVDAYMLFFMF